MTGGTGLYLRALLEGLFAGPQRSEETRARLHHSAELHGPAWLHRLLRRLDPAAAHRIHANDQPKLIRAIEVCLAARQPLTEAWKTGRDPLTGYRILRIGLDPPRSELYARIDARAAKMFADGSSKKPADSSANMATRHLPSIPSATVRPAPCCAVNAPNSKPSLPPARHIATTRSASSPGFAGNRTSTGSRDSATTPPSLPRPPSLYNRCCDDCARPQPSSKPTRIIDEQSPNHRRCDPPVVPRPAPAHPLVLVVNGYHPYRRRRGHLYRRGPPHSHPSLYPLNAAFPAAFTQLSLFAMDPGGDVRLSHFPLSWALFAA